jgi:exonuclease SbcC
MKLDRLRLKGITCFHQPVDLDFTKIPAGLIAIVGENGSGKTTLMEAFAGAVYGELPTRGAVAKYSSEKDSYLEATTTFDSTGTFRARRNIDGVKGVQDALLERVDTGDRLNDGKVTTFKVAVEKVFPSLDTMLASCLAVQSRKGSFATRDKAERKELFYALLGLNKYEEYAATARASAAVLEKRIAELTGRRDALLESTADVLHEQLQAQAYALTEDLARAEDAKAKLAADLAIIDEELVRLRADVIAKGEALTEWATRHLDAAARYRPQVDNS